MPIYLTGKTFAILQCFGNTQMLDVLRKMWGDDVNRIRCIEYTINIGVRHFTMEYNAFLPPLGARNTEDVSVSVKMKLLQTSVLVVRPSSSVTAITSTLPRGAMCHCELDRIAGRLSYEGNDVHGIFEMTAACDKFDRTIASGRPFPRCNLPAMANSELGH